MIGFIQVLLTFVAIGLLIFMIMKKAYAPMSLLALGFIILFSGHCSQVKALWGRNLSVTGF